MIRDVFSTLDPMPEWPGSRAVAQPVLRMANQGRTHAPATWTDWQPKETA